jgi:drug/metabolite transporter (DMT)-like permease
VLGLAVIAGVAFGVVFVLLAETGDSAGFWPLVAGRAMSVALMTVGALLARRSVWPAPGARNIATIGLTGVFDVSANAVYLLAARRGLLALVAVLSSLYPAATVVLARAVLDDRMTRMQIVGLVLAAAGVVLIAAG